MTAEKMNPPRKEKGNLILILSCILITGLIFIRDIVDIDFSRYILLVFCVAPIPFLSYSNFLCLMGFLFALTFGIPSTYVYLVAAITLLFHIGSRKFDAKALALFLVFVAWELFLSALIHPTDTPLTTYVGYFSRLFIFFMLICENRREINYNKVLRAFCLGVFVFISIVVLIYFKDNTFEAIENGWVRLGNIQDYSESGAAKLIQMSTNTNNVAYFCIAGMACCLTLLYTEKRFFWSVLFFSIFAMGSLTISRTFFFLSAVLLVVHFFVVLLGAFPVYQKVILACLIVAGVFIFLEIGTIEIVSNRVDEAGGVLQDSRSMIFAEYWNAFWSDFQSVVMGAGALDHVELYSMKMSTHNALQQILISYGLGGFLIFFVFLMAQLRKGFSAIKKRSAAEIMMKMIPFIIIFIFIQTIQFINPPDLMLIYIMGMFALRTRFSGEEEKIYGRI